MPRFFCLLLILGTVFSSGWSQVSPSRYFVRFTDKSGSPYSITNPSAFLTSRAIERRTKQGIAIAENDLPVNSSYVSGIISKGGIVLNRSRWFNGVVVQVPDSAALDSIKALPYVTSVTDVAPVKNQGAFKTRDKFSFGEITGSFKAPSFSVTNGYDYGASLNQIAMMNGDVLHMNGFTGKGLVIAVIDAGFYAVNSITAFDSLWAAGRILGTYDFVAGDTSVYEDHSHGMMVLSTMGGHIPGEIVGTAPDASYWLLRSEDAWTEYIIEEYNWLSAAEFADSVGADIINSSLGYTTFDDPSQNHTYADMDGNTAPGSIAADMAASKGILVVNSAGNEGSSSWNFIGVPADGDSVLAVGAVNAGGVYASFSSNGPSSNGQVKPNVACQGQGTIIVNASGMTQPGNGTSFSGPVMAGMAACLWQANPAYNNMAIKTAIEQSAHQYSSPDTLLGYGIPDFVKANLILSGIQLKKYTSDELETVFPNPFNDYLVFSFFSDTNQTIRISLINMIGQEVYQEEKRVGDDTVNKLVIYTPGTAGKGIYFLRINSMGGEFMEKVVKVE